MIHEARTVSYSQTTITELMVPAYANFGGKIHGGFLMSLMDKAAYACASKHAGTYCVTVAVENVEFHQPVDVGDLIYMLASVNYVGNTSMVVGIKVVAENVKMGIVKHTNSSYFTMVAKNDEDQPCQVPELILESRDDVRRFSEAIQRRKLKAEHESSWKKITQPFNMDAIRPILEGSRCRISLKKQR